MRIFAFFMAILLCLSLFACTPSEKQPDVTDPSATNDPSGAGEVTEDPAAKWDDVYFRRENIIIGLSTYSPIYMTNAGATHSVKYIQGPDNYTTDAVQNAVFDRNAEVAVKLGIRPIYTHIDYDLHSDVLPLVEDYVLADLADCPDIVSLHGYGMIRAAITGLLHNALDDSGYNYFDFSHEGWYSDLMYGNTLDNSKIYLLAGDYFIDILRFSYGVLLNIDMYDNLFAAEGGSESLFDLIEEGRWTYDHMMRYAEKAHVDRGEIGEQDEEDTFGIVHDAAWFTRTCIATSGINLFEEKDGKVAYTQDISQAHDLIDKLLTMKKSPYFKPNPYAKVYRPIDIFLDGKTLFAFDSPLLQLEGTVLQSLEMKSAIIPHPKYNIKEPYRALVSDNTNYGAILLNSNKFAQCTAFLQLSTELSNGGPGTLIHEYFEVAMKYKLSDVPEQVSMLEIIRRGVCSPTYSLFDLYVANVADMTGHNFLMNDCLDGNTNTFASDWASQYDAMQKTLETIIATYGN